MRFKPTTTLAVTAILLASWLLPQLVFANAAEDEEREFLNEVRERAVEMTELSRVEANYIQFCFAGSPDPKNIFAKFSNADPLVARVILDMCDQLRPKILEQAKHLPEYRRKLSLIESGHRIADVEELSYPAMHKLNIWIAPQFYDFSWKRIVVNPVAQLTQEEIKNAVAEYDRGYLEISKRFFPGYDRRKRPSEYQRPRDYQARMALEMKVWRKEREEEAFALVRANPLLMHMYSSKYGASEIAEAAVRVRERAEDALKRLEEKKREIETLHDDAFDLLVIEGAVADVLQENPRFASTLVRAQAKYQQISARKKVNQAAFGVSFTLGCFMLTRAAEKCAMVGASLAAADHFFEVYPRHMFRLAALESALSADRSIVRLVHELDESERAVFFAGLLVILPWEAVLAYPVHVAYAGQAVSLGSRVIRVPNIPAFTRVVDKVSTKAKLKSGELLKRILAGIERIGAQYGDDISHIPF